VDARLGLRLVWPLVQSVLVWGAVGGSTLGLSLSQCLWVPPRRGRRVGLGAGSPATPAVLFTTLNPSSYPPPANGDKSVPPFPLQEMIAQKLERIEVYI